MMFSYTRPTVVTIELVGDGAEFLTDPDALINGRPGDPTALQWLATDTPSTDDFVEIQFSWTSAPIVPRCEGIILPNLDLALPAGVRVEAWGNTGGGFNYDLGGNTQDQRTVLLASGAAAAWFVNPVDLDPNNGIAFRIYNDRDGAPWADASTVVLLGEFWFGAGADFRVAQDYKQKLLGGLLQRKAHNNQSWPLLTQPWRSLGFNLSPMQELEAIGPNPRQDDFETVANRIGTEKACVVIPSYLDRYANTSTLPPIDESVIHSQRLQRFARLGVMDQPPEFDGNGDVYVVAPLSHGETPP